jgi:hypothetical protein
MAVALPALAVNDFNSSRSNREKGTLAVSPPASGASAGDERAPVAQQARDFNTTRSNKDKRATTVGGPDQDCDGVACAKTGKTGHVTLNR